MQGFEFSVLGFDVRVGPSALILVALLFVLGADGPSPVGMLVWPVVGVLSILLHELGHAVVTRGFGLRVDHISFHALGGATVHEPAKKPWQSLLIAVAGPLAGFLVVPPAWFLLGQPLSLTVLIVVQAIFFINLVWGIFNLFPIRPLDGGQATFSILCMFMPPHRAHVITGWIGLVLAGLLALVALQQGQWYLAAFAAYMAYRNWQYTQSAPVSRSLF